jgi:hypothetical protein
VIITIPIRDAVYYPFRILAVAQRSDGKLNCPVIDFFQAHRGHLEKLSALLELTARNGTPINREKFKSIEKSGHMLEFKAFQHRLLCFHDEGQVIVCTNGVVKKSDALRPETIKIGENWRKAYFAAKLNSTLKHESEN